MKKICAWCSEEIIISIVEPAVDDVSHGICFSCANQLLKNFKIPLDVFFDELNVPALIIDNKGIIKAGNKSAEDTFSKGNLVDIKGGDLIECKNARLPGGCGNTPGCKGCEFRNIIFETYLTGQKFSNKSIEITNHSEGTFAKLKLNISTQKIGEYVYLIINKSIKL